MEILGAIRALPRFRLLLGVVVAASLLVGATVRYHVEPPAKLTSRGYEVGIASAQALVDTPSSQIADLGGVDSPADISTLAARASLLANLLANAPMKQQIAARAGLRPTQLIAVPPPSAQPGAPPVTDSPAMSKPDATILRVTVPELQSGQIPVISVDTQAPTAAGARRIADAAIVVLRQQLSTIANDDRVPADRRVVVRPLGAALATTERRGPGTLAALAAVIATFLALSALIVGLTTLARSWKRANALMLEVPVEPDEVDDERGWSTYGPATAGAAEPPSEVVAQPRGR